LGLWEFQNQGKGDRELRSWGEELPLSRNAKSTLAKKKSKKWGLKWKNRGHHKRQFILRGKGGLKSQGIKRGTGNNKKGEPEEVNMMPFRVDEVNCTSKKGYEKKRSRKSLGFPQGKIGGIKRYLAGKKTGKNHQR